MKYIRTILFFIIVFLLPSFVLANDGEFPKEDNIQTKEVFHDPKMISNSLPDISKKNSYLFSDSYVYEDGVYKLNGNVQQEKVEDYPYDQNAEQPVIYTCKPYQGYTTECPELYVVFPKVTYSEAKHSDQVRPEDYYLALVYSDGEEYSEGDEYVYYSEEYEELANGKYRLTNPEKVYKSDFIDMVDVYTCANFSEYECDELYQIKREFRRMIFVDDFGGRIPFGSTYTYKDGKYILEDTILINPAFYRRFGGLYTCLTKEESCEILYKVLFFNEFIIAIYNDGMYGFGTSVINYQVITPSDTKEEVELEFDETKEITDIKSTDRIIVEDEEILSAVVKGGIVIIEPKKAGATNVIIISEEEKMRIINIVINSNLEPPVNPNTKDEILNIVKLSLVCLTIILVNNKKIKNSL